ncbi:MAG: DsbA family oxidoreductase [Anaerolineae bacterium]
MSLHVDVWSDFVCPWCYLVSTSLEKLQASHGVTVAWKAYELRPKGSPPMPEAYKARIKAMTPQMLTMAREHYGIDMQAGPLGIESRKALIGDKFAEAQELSDAYHKAVFEAYWLQGRNIGEQDVLAEIAVSIGLERETFIDALEDEQLEAQVEADIAQARVYDIQGVPALIFENKYYIPGAQPYEELVRFAEQITRRLETER